MNPPKLVWWVLTATPKSQKKKKLHSYVSYIHTRSYVSTTTDDDDEKHCVEIIIFFR